MVVNTHSVPSGQLAFRVWAENLPLVGSSLRDLRFLFLARCQLILELFTEMVGTALFAMLGNVSDPAGTGRDGWPALGNGVTLAVLVYMTAKVSGGKLNPAVSFGLFCANSISVWRFLAETLVQIIGAIIGSRASQYLTDGAHLVPGTSTQYGCFGTQSTRAGIGAAQVFTWELVTTFVLVSVVTATAVEDTAAQAFISTAPLAIGLALFACAQASGPFTGACLNPARFLAPSIIYGCGWTFAAAYILGEMAGGGLAGLLFRLRLRLQYLVHEHIAELKAKERDEA